MSETMLLVEFLVEIRLFCIRTSSLIPMVAMQLKSMMSSARLSIPY